MLRFLLIRFVFLSLLILNDFTIATGQTTSSIKNLSLRNKNCLDVNFNLNVVLVINKLDRAVIYDLKQGNKIKSFAGHSDSTTTCKFQPNGNLFITGGKDGKIIIWETESYKPKAVYISESPIFDSFFSNYDKNILFVVFAKKIECINVETALKIYEIPIIFEELSSYGSSISENSIFLLKKDLNLSIIGSSSGKTLFTTTLNTKISTIKCFSQNEIYLVSDDNQVLKLDLKTNLKIIVPNQLDQSINSILPISAKEIIVLYSDKISYLNLIDNSTIFEKGFTDSKYVFVDIKSSSLLLGNENFLESFQYEKNKVDNSSNYEITIIEPCIISGSKYIAESKEIEIKGTVSFANEILAILINGVEAEFNKEKFASKVKIAYGDNDISIKCILKNNRMVEKKIVIYRELDKSQNYTNLSQRSGKDYVLLIATNQYDNFGQLVNPVFDATTIEEELKNYYGFETNKLIDPSIDEIYEKIRHLSQKLYSETDQVFIFIAGHGLFDPVFKEGYLVCKNSKKDDVSKSSYISHSNLRTIINNINCKHILLMLDVCFGGTFDQRVAQRGDEESQINREEFILRKMRHISRLYITSGGKEYVPDGRPGYHSPFARKFIEALRSYGGNDKILNFTEIISNINNITPEPRYGEFGNNMPGSDFLFIAK